MARRVHCGKKTKIYIPKTINPQIISYRISAENSTQIPQRQLDYVTPNGMNTENAKS